MSLQTLGKLNMQAINFLAQQAAVHKKLISLMSKQEASLNDLNTIVIAIQWIQRLERHQSGDTAAVPSLGLSALSRGSR